MHRIIAVIPVTWVGEVFGYEKRRSIAYLLMPVPQHPKGDMTQTPISVAERRLAVARRLYEALVDQDPDCESASIFDPRRTSSQASEQQVVFRKQVGSRLDADPILEK